MNYRLAHRYSPQRYHMCSRVASTVAVGFSLCDIYCIYGIDNRPPPVACTLTNSQHTDWGQLFNFIAKTKASLELAQVHNKIRNCQIDKNEKFDPFWLNYCFAVRVCVRVTKWSSRPDRIERISSKLLIIFLVCSVAINKANNSQAYVNEQSKVWQKYCFGNFKIFRGNCGIVEAVQAVLTCCCANSRSGSNRLDERLD